MMPVQFEIIIIASITAAACAIPGTFLVLRRMSMLTDAISHAILLGIVGGFFIAKRIDSPLIVLAAAMVGVITVLLVELLVRTKLVKEDASIAVVYPLLFSIAVVLISLYASQVHIDTDAVLMGELAFAPLDRFAPNGVDLGPLAYYQIGGVLILNILLTFLFYKELKLALFDENYARSISFPVRRVIYGLMFMASITIVVSFSVAGSIMVVGFMVGPAVIASFFTRRLWTLLILAPVIGIVASVYGYSLSHEFDVSIAGSITIVIGLLFLTAFLFSTKSGLVPQIFARKRMRTEFSIDNLLVHLWQHEVLGDCHTENYQDTVCAHFNCDPEFISDVVNRSVQRKYISVDNGFMMLLPEGKERAQQVLER